MITKKELATLQLAGQQSQARLANYKANKVTAKKAREATADVAGIAAGESATDVICRWARALQAECDFMRGNITIAAAVKASTADCDCDKPKP